MDQPVKTKITQNKELLSYLKAHKAHGITTWDAANNLGIMRLSARISDLRGAGFKIKTIKETGVNRLGHTTNYARYVLESENA